ncbi:hypothetical protein [Mycolicibacterium komossense]|uniref:DUF5642 domain-containing protein n=1 Tax=Mycolicibacterium komossense TaxID=1779 RepID=A0ABT3CEG2_9MYCO|nr:hypothetical protein [Mycolicibacterium komossense]MCV7227879.1 hypothetical protein [Mycolicibacterium komossense]
MTKRSRLALIAAGCLAVTLSGGLIVLGVQGLDRVDTDDDDTSYSEQASDLSALTESMLIEENVVPPVAGTTWGRMVAVPRGVAPPVSPPDCGLFLSQAEASQEGLAMRSARGTAIGIELAITDTAQDLGALAHECSSFTFDGGPTQSSVELAPLDVPNLPAGTIATVMHCRSVTGGKTTSWDIALIAGYYRGVLVSAQYTPGPVGGPFDPRLAASLPGIYTAQIERLDEA